jgi:hypothetical protein
MMITPHLSHLHRLTASGGAGSFVAFPFKPDLAGDLVPVVGVSLDDPAALADMDSSSVLSCGFVLSCVVSSEWHSPASCLIVCGCDTGYCAGFSGGTLVTWLAFCYGATGEGVNGTPSESSMGC